MASKPAPASSASYLLGRALLPLCAFLGFTFSFAGLQKLATTGLKKLGIAEGPNGQLYVT